MSERLSDDDLDRLDELIRWEHDGGGTGQELADMARDLLVEVRAARAREAASEWEVDPSNWMHPAMQRRRLVGPWEAVDSDDHE